MAKNKTLDTESVKQFLSNNIDFFIDQKDLVRSLRIPHFADGGISLIEHQVSVLRQENERVKNQLHEMVKIAEDNQRIFAATRKFALQIMQVYSLEELIAQAEEALTQDFEIDLVSIRLIPSDTVTLPDSIKLLAMQEIDQLFGSQFLAGEPNCGQLEPEQLEYLFGKEANKIASSALVPLGNRGALGVMALASYDDKRFTEADGTLFLSFIGDLLSQMLPQRLQCLH